MYRFLSGKQLLGCIFYVLIERGVDNVFLYEIYCAKNIVDAGLRKHCEGAVVNFRSHEIRSAVDNYQDLISIKDTKDDSIIYLNLDLIDDREEIEGKLATYFTSGIPRDMYNITLKILRNSLNLRVRE